MRRRAALLVIPVARALGCASRVYAPAPVSFNRPAQLGNAVTTLDTQVRRAPSTIPRRRGRPSAASTCTVRA